jgi:hypothetical protein
MVVAPSMEYMVAERTYDHVISEVLFPRYCRY